VSRDALSLGSLMRSGLVPADIYLPFDTESTGDALLLSRAVTDARSLVRPIGQVVRASPSAAVSRVSVLGDEVTFVPRDSLFLIRLIGAFGLVALLLAATGIFGVVSQSVVQRTTEFGVRIAMGASSGQVLRMVLAREAKLIVAGVGIGALATAGVTRAVFPELLMVGATDSRLWVAVMVLCAGFAGAAVALATYRIVRLDPWVVLRRI
jgi:putative ABC transport system permease protein